MTTPTLAAIAAALPKGVQFASWDGPATLI
jgi:hypothetical protein